MIRSKRHAHFQSRDQRSEMQSPKAQERGAARLTSCRPPASAAPEAHAQHPTSIVRPEPASRTPYMSTSHNIKPLTRHRAPQSSRLIHRHARWAEIHTKRIWQGQQGFRAAWLEMAPKGPYRVIARECAAREGCRATAIHGAALPHTEHSLLASAVHHSHLHDLNSMQ